jgi:hypothetical protein
LLPLLLPPLELPLEPAPPLDEPELLPDFPPSADVPPEVGATHAPPVHSPLQQSAADEQVDPFEAHVAPWHVPALQLWLQQALLVVHVASSAAHVGCAQRLFVHVPLQQSLP